MRTLRELFGGGDLFHLALVLSLLRVDLRDQWMLRHSLHNRLLNEYQIEHRINPISQKVINDLSELGRYGRPLGADPQEIAAYILNTETNVDANSFSSENQENQQDGNLILPQPFRAQEDLDSGVSDIGQNSDCETDGSRSPDNINFPIEFPDLLSPASSLGIGDEFMEVSSSSGRIRDVQQGVEGLRADVSKFSVQDPSFDGFDWNEIENMAMQQEEDLEQPNPTAFETDDVTVGEFLWSNDTLMQGEDPAKYVPDEEDVENQLIEIDNRLITLDGSIENLSDGVRHLGEQLATAQTDEAVEALLASLTDPDPGTALDIEAAGMIDSSFHGFEDWHLDEADSAMEDLFSNVVPSRDISMPEDVFIKTELDEDKNITSANSEKVKPVNIKKEEIKEEPLDYNDDQLLDFEDFLFKEEVPCHLVDHTYAASADLMFPPKGSSFSMDFEYDGATALAAASPMSFSSESSRSRESRDERKARELGIPFSISDIIDSPMEEFNVMLSRTSLTDEQVALCRDIRRRGKNKVAAQNCRRRKLDLISSLEVEVTRARYHKQQLLAEREELYRQRHEWSEKLRQLEEAVLRGLNKDINQFSLQLSPDGESISVADRHSQRLTKPTRA